MGEVISLPTIKVSRTHSIEVVESVIKHPSIFDLISDDASPGIDDTDLSKSIADKSTYFVRADVDGELAGIVIFHVSRHPCIYEAHLNVLPEYWGKGLSRRIAAMAFFYMFMRDKAKEIIAKIPMTKDCDTVLVIANKIGMRCVGVSRRTHVKGGRAYDEYIMSVDLKHLKIGANNNGLCTNIS